MSFEPHFELRKPERFTRLSPGFKRLFPTWLSDFVPHARISKIIRKPLRHVIGEKWKLRQHFTSVLIEVLLAPDRLNKPAAPITPCLPAPGQSWSVMLVCVTSSILVCFFRLQVSAPLTPITGLDHLWGMAGLHFLCCSLETRKLAQLSQEAQDSLRSLTGNNLYTKHCTCISPLKFRSTVSQPLFPWGCIVMCVFLKFACYICFYLNSKISTYPLE